MSRSSLLYAALVAAAFLANGCIQAKDDVKVQKDGSGSFTEEFTVDLKVMKEITDMFKGFGGPGGETPGGVPPPPAMEGEEKKPNPEIEKLKKHFQSVEGVELTKFEPWEKEGKAGTHIEATFKTLEAYAKVSGLESSAELKKNEDGSYTLTFTGEGGDEAKKPAAPGEPGMGDTPPAMGDDPMAGMGQMFGAMLEPLMKDLEMTRSLTLPGTIVSTNGVKSEDGSTVTWKLTFKDFKDTKSGGQTVTFKGEDLDLKPFKVRREHEGMGGGMHGMPGGPPGGK